MSVERVDLRKCIGCETCIGICPMDVFRFDHRANKSVIAFPENCQSCCQCVLNCQGHALRLTNNTYGFAQTSYRAVTSIPVYNIDVTGGQAYHIMTDGVLP